MKEQPSYYAIVPASVRYDKDLNANEKLIYGEITALSNKKGYCWSTNNYFAELYEVHKKTVSRWINNLGDKGYISIQLIYSEHSKQVKQRRLYINDSPINSVMVRGDRTKVARGVHADAEEELSTTSSNITSSNTSAELTERFESLWKLYPRKQGKKDAQRHYEKAIKEGTTDQEIEEGIKSYVKEIELTNTARQYIRHGSAWFNQRGWEDEYLVEGKQSYKPIDSSTTSASAVFNDIFDSKGE